MSTSIIHVGFDMGIRNLAYCVIEHADTTWKVNAWDNVDLLEDGKSAQAAKKCGACGAAAKWIGEGIKWCNACATGVRRKKSASRIPTFPTLPASASGVKGLRSVAAEKGMTDTKKASKDVLLSWLAERYLMPWKPEKAGNVALQVILRKMDIWLTTVLPTLATASLIRLENQPVMKGPTMKSVQIMLFTLLSHRLLKEYGWSGNIEFVHAGVKTRGAAAPQHVTTTSSDEATEPTEFTEPPEVKDSEAYRARKQTAESEVERLLTERGTDAAMWLSFFKSRTKKSDLADAFLMALRR
jgi:hypothetical protein